MSATTSDFAAVTALVPSKANGKKPAPVDPQDEVRTPKTWPTPAERAMKLGALRTVLPTGYATLDEAMRGGFPTGKLIVIGGPPGAAKTTLAANIGHHYARAGYAVTEFAGDEEADGLLVRHGQLEGLDRDGLESGDPTLRQMLHDRMAALPLFDLADQEEAELTIEDAADAMFARAGDKPCVFIADSLQEIKTRVPAADDTVRSRVNAAVKGLKAICRRGALVLVTSEMARGFYRSRRAKDNSTAMASFKESGGIEYGVHVALSMVEDADAPGFFFLEVVKNRVGKKKPKMRLRLDFATARMVEVERLVEDEDAQLTLPTPKVQFEKLKVAILELIKSAPGLTSKNAICARVKGGNKTEKLQAIIELLEVGKLTDLGTGGGFRAV